MGLGCCSEDKATIAKILDELSLFDVNHIKSSKSRRIFALCVYGVFLIQDKYLFFTKI